MDEIVKRAEELRERMNRAVAAYHEAKERYVNLLRLGRSLEPGQELEGRHIDYEEVKGRKRLHDQTLAQRLAAEEEYRAFVRQHGNHLSEQGFQP